MEHNSLPPVLFSPPAIGAAEAARVATVLASGWVTTGPETAEFERRFREFVGAEASLAVNSCTAALSLALRVVGVGPGDEVVTTTNTFVSTVNVIEHCGARPVLVDIEPDTMNIDPRAVDAAIGPLTKAVIAVHYAGHPVDLTALQAICDARGIPLIEDAAHAVPAKHEGRMIGGTGNLTAFSFYATKNLTTGEGGMLTGTADLVDRARTLSLHGMSRNAWNRYGDSGRWRYDVVEAGFKCNLSDLQSAIGIAQLERLPELQARRQEVYRRYNEAFTSNRSLETPALRDGVEHALHLYVLRVRGGAAERDDLIEGLYADGVRPSLHFIPVHHHTYYRERYGEWLGDFPVADSCFERMLSLPLSPALRDDEVERVITAVLRHAPRTLSQVA